MRVAATFIVGGVVTAASIIVAMASDGLPAAAAWIAAIFAATVTVGLTTAAVVESWIDRPVTNPNMPQPQRRRVIRATRCTCGDKMQRAGSLLLCPSCDRVPMELPR